MVMRFKDFINSLGMSDCDCPKDHVPFLQLSDTCLCLPEDEMKHLRCTLRPDYGSLEESVRSALPDTPLDFDLASGVMVRIASTGLFIKIKDGKWVPIPTSEKGRIWEIVADRLLD